MARRIIISLPDDEQPLRDADYIRAVGQQVRNGYLSGHEDAEHHWTTERD